MTVSWLARAGIVTSGTWVTIPMPSRAICRRETAASGTRRQAVIRFPGRGAQACERRCCITSAADYDGGVLLAALYRTGRSRLARLAGICDRRRAVAAMTRTARTGLPMCRRAPAASPRTFPNASICALRRNTQSPLWRWIMQAWTDARSRGAHACGGSQRHPGMERTAVVSRVNIAQRLVDDFLDRYLQRPCCTRWHEHDGNICARSG